jgi:hypothetical protein
VPSLRPWTTTNPSNPARQSATAAASRTIQLGISEDDGRDGGGIGGGS